MVTHIETSGTIARLAAPVRLVVQTVTLWTLRARQRHHLRELPDHMLRDIGLDRQMAQVEAGKPFWTP